MENDTFAFLQQWIKFVPKKANPTCVASLRPIEDSWAALKKAVYDKGWKATSFLTLKQRIRQKTRKVPLPIVLPLFNAIK